MNKVYINGIGKYVPEKILSNADLEKMVDTTDEWITTRTGIKERRMAAEDQACSDLAVEAAKEAIEDAGLTAEDIDLIIVATISGDMQFPATACIVQDKLGAKKSVAFDISAACSGFPYALSIGSQFIKAGVYKHALIIGSEVLTRFIDFTDRSTCILFGDGAGAAVISSENGDNSLEVVSDTLGADGSFVDLLKTPGGGSQIPPTLESVEAKKHFLTMEGKEVFKVAVNSMVSVVNEILEKNNLSINDIKCLVPHQANLRIINAVGKGVGINDENVYVNVDRYGNMSSATTIVALYDAVKEGVVGKGDLALMVAFGGGFVWGGTLIKC